MTGNAWFGLIFRKINLATVDGTGLRAKDGEKSEDDVAGIPER